MPSEDQSRDHIHKVVASLVGDDAANIFTYLYERGGEATEEEIASKMKMRMNAVRKALYSLLEQNLVSYRRVRDKNSGWYVYYWQVHEGQLLALILSRKRAVLDKLKARLAFELENTFYQCPADSTRYSFNEAVEYEFTCPRCGASLVYVDNTSVVRVLKEVIKRLEEELRVEQERAASR